MYISWSCLLADIGKVILSTQQLPGTGESVIINVHQLYSVRLTQLYLCELSMIKKGVSREYAAIAKPQSSINDINICKY